MYFMNIAKNTVRLPEHEQLMKKKEKLKKIYKPLTDYWEKIP